VRQHACWSRAAAGSRFPSCSFVHTIYWHADSTCTLSGLLAILGPPAGLLFPACHAGLPVYGAIHPQCYQGQVRLQDIVLLCFYHPHTQPQHGPHSSSSSSSYSPGATHQQFAAKLIAECAGNSVAWQQHSVLDGHSASASAQTAHTPYACSSCCAVCSSFTFRIKREPDTSTDSGAPEFLYG
jgi:hypothetical protein